MPILNTKLHFPTSRPKLVSRSHLIKQLNEGLHRKLSLISAPAGFGKTTLVSEWLSDYVGSVAWLSLDENDNEDARFLNYFVAAIQTVQPHIGDNVMAVLQSPQAPPIESILTILLNEITTIPDNFILVLDDYHLVDSPSIDKALSFLLKNLPPQVHLVIITREDPNLSLARLRARSQLTELRVADLRFTPNEASDFLNQVMGLNLSQEAIEALETRTEGWIVGLQLAAVSMQGHQEPVSFIESFTGSHHFVLDYLLEEVLNQQSESIQTFLLNTSILNRLCGSLCDALLLDSSESSQATLEYLERTNLFLMPLDHERGWYRYHHLFGELLRQRLNQEKVDVTLLHSRASQWYEDNGFEIEAFQHAIDANDIDRAEHLLNGHDVPLLFQGVVNPVLNWLNSLPVSVLNAHPSLWVWSAHASTFLGEASGIEEKLQAAEIALGDDALEDKNRNFVGHIATIRAMLAIPYNQIDILIYQSQRALDYLDVDNVHVRTSAMWTLGYAYQTQGKRSAAIQTYSEALSASKASGNFMNILATSICLAQVLESEILFDQATENFQQIIQSAGDLPYSCEAYLGLARMSYERNELDAADAYGQQSAQLGNQIENVDTSARGLMVRARIKLIQGDVAGALSLLDKSEQIIRQKNFLHQISNLAEMQVKVLLYQGNLTGAAHLVDQHDIPISKARLYLAQGDPSSALAILEPLHQQMAAKAWQDEQLKITILESIALYRLNKLEEALELLSGVLLLAQSTTLVRSFLDEGQAMMELLSEAVAHGIVPDYANKLLSAFGAKQSPTLSPASQDLIEALSERELEVLHFIAEGLSNREISEKLYLALSTVKGHNRNIFDKLSVQRRTEAVARARELGLI